MTPSDTLSDIITAASVALVSILGAIGALITMLVKIHAEVKANRIKTDTITETQQMTVEAGTDVAKTIDRVERKMEEHQKLMSGELRGLRKDIGRLQDVDLETRKELYRMSDHLTSELTRVTIEFTNHVQEVPLVVRNAQQEALTIIREEMKQ